MQRVFLLLCTSILLFCFVSGCSTASKTPVGKIHEISHLIPDNVHFRRTATKGADPYAGPGGIDYLSEIPPNGRFDCEAMPLLFKDIDLGGLRTCLKSVAEPLQIRFELKRDPAPSFVLSADEKTPECIKLLLPAIPVPREIFFETIEDSRAVCYASRLNIEEDELFWVKMPLARKVLDFKLPLVAAPGTDEETLRLLFAFALTPFWSGRGHSIPSVYVPEPLCNACIGEKNRIDLKAAPSNLWP